MESNFNNRDFERFVKQNADQYRMFPTEKVWKEIHAALHTRRRWYGIGLVLLFITVALVTAVMLIPGNKTSEMAYAPVPVRNSQDIIPGVPAANSNTANIPRENKQEANISLKITPSETVSQARLFTLDEVITAGDNTTQASGYSETDQIVAMEDNFNLDRPAAIAAYSRQIKQGVRDFNPPLLAAPSSTSFLNPVVNKTSLPVAKNPAGKNPEDDNRLPLIADRNTKDRPVTGAGRKKLNWLLYVAPTVSYRTLAENIDYLSMARYNSFVNGGNQIVYPADVNTVVIHRPDLGFQLGLHTAYPVSRWFSLTGGLQLSVSKYDIKAYDHPAEVATIALRDRNVAAVSKYRNTNGYKENWLRNFYFSVSFPVGAELKLSDGSKNYFGIAGTLQPTYVLDNRSYLISTDYKNYAEVPSLTRRWNMNTSFEVFSAHTTGKLKWRVGPQVRYQVMSSFSKNYPIKEHLFDFGLKMGIQLK